MVCRILHRETSLGYGNSKWKNIQWNWKPTLPFLNRLRKHPVSHQNDVPCKVFNCWNIISMLFGMKKHSFSCHCTRVQNNPITNYFFIRQPPPAVTKAPNFCLHLTKGCMCFHWNTFSSNVPHVSNGCYYRFVAASRSRLLRSRRRNWKTKSNSF